MVPFLHGIHSQVPGFLNVTGCDLLSFVLWQTCPSVLRHTVPGRHRSVDTGARLNSPAQRKDGRA